MKMKLDKLRDEIVADEGCEFKLYLDHLALKTFGIGHLVTEDDPEHKMAIGEPVSKDRVHQAFNLDILVTLEDCRRLYDDFDELPEECQHIVANMCFNLGYPRLSRFVGMKAGVDARNWHKAADEMVDSKWYTQVPNRAKRLVERMRDLANEQDAT